MTHKHITCIKQHVFIFNVLAKFVLSHNYLSDTAMSGTVATSMILSNCQALNSMDALPELPIHSRDQSWVGNLIEFSQLPYFFFLAILYHIYSASTGQTRKASMLANKCVLGRFLPESGN